MPTFTFEGFTEGSLVALSAAEGAQRASGSVPQWRLSSMNTATIDFTTDTHAEVVAPAGVWFEATGYSGFNVSEDLTSPTTRDPSFHEIFHVWDFDDPGAFNTALNMPTAWNSKNVDYGKKVYHVFDTPGAYAITLWAVDSEGNVGVRTKNVVVQDPATLYAGTRTICVSNQSDWTGAPSGSNNVTTIAAAQSALAALGQTGRILLRRGETYTEQFRYLNTHDNLHIGAFGSGARPVWQPQGAAPCIGAGNGYNQPAYPKDVMIWGIRFEGEWDATRETGDPRGKVVDWVQYNSVTDYHKIFYDCEMAGMLSYSLFGAVNTSGGISALVDCEVTSWQDYGVTQFTANVVNMRVALVGCSIHQPENACLGDQGKSGIHNHHGPLRFEWVKELIISACDFYSANSWFDPLPQPCLRLFTAQPGGPAQGYLSNINRIACEGGFEIVSVSCYDQNGAMAPGNHVLDMALMVPDYTTVNAFRWAYGGTTVRNVLMASPNISTRSSLGSGFTVPVGTGFTSANTNAIWDVSHCTLLNLASSSTWSETNSPSLSNFSYADTVNHQPDRSVTPDAPINITQTIAGFATRNRGRRLSVPAVALSGSMADDASATANYPTGTSASDFSTSGRHTINNGGEGGSYWFSHHGDFEISFGGSNITVTNRSGGPIPAANLKLDRDTLSTETAYGSPSTLPLPVPTAIPAAPLTNGVPYPYAQFDTAIRTRAWGAV